MKNCYHNPCDDLSQVTSERLAFMAKISDSLYKTLDALGGKGPTSGAGSIWNIGECL